MIHGLRSLCLCNFVLDVLFQVIEVQPSVLYGSHQKLPNARLR